MKFLLFILVLCPALSFGQTKWKDVQFIFYADNLESEWKITSGFDSTEVKARKFLSEGYLFISLIDMLIPSSYQKYPETNGFKIYEVNAAQGWENFKLFQYDPALQPTLKGNILKFEKGQFLYLSTPMRNAKVIRIEKPFTGMFFVKNTDSNLIKHLAKWLD